MFPIHRRLAELWSKKGKDNGLTDDECLEFTMCLNVNMDYAYQLSRLENLSYLAYMTNDTDWLHDICKDIDDLEDKFIRIFRQLKK